MTFDLISKKGIISKGNTEFNDGFYKGKNIFKEENDVLYINDSQFTTCDKDNPHFHFHSNNMKVIPCVCWCNSVSLGNSVSLCLLV